jgi:hypothetical protein
MRMLVIGSVLLLASVPVAVVGTYIGRFWRVMRQVEIVSPDELTKATGAERERGQPTTRLCAVTGTASASADGALTSTVNRERCVWYRYAVVHREVRHRRDSKGRLRRSSRRRRAGGHTSEDPFFLVGRVGRVEIRPRKMRIHRPERGRTRVLPGKVGEPFPDADAIMGSGGVQNTYHHREWILREGAQLYVLGEVTRAGDMVILGKPAKGPHILSTRTGTQLLSQARLVSILTVVAAVVSATTGLVMVIVAGLR